MPQPFAHLAELPVPAPFYLRLLPNGSSWGDDNTPPDDRVKDVWSHVFRPQDPEQSLFLIESDDDYRRVVVGMSQNRRKPKEGAFWFVQFRHDELLAAGIHPVHSSEDATGCFLASRKLHFNAPADEQKLTQLCLHAFHAKRPSVDVRKGALTGLHTAANAEGCPAQPTSAHPHPTLVCRVAECVTLPAPTNASTEAA